MTATLERPMRVPIELSAADVARFLRKRDERGPAECWPIDAALNSSGYPQFRVGKRVLGAHRVALFIATGIVPDTADYLCHTRESGCPGGSACWHRPCTNPTHLDDTSQRDNTLRGMGVSALHALKAECDNGHALTPENVYTPPRQPLRRMCRKCRANYGRK